MESQNLEKVDAAQVLASAEVVDWLVQSAERAGCDAEKVAMFAIRMRILQAALGQLAYAIARSEDTDAIVRVLIELEK